MSKSRLLGYAILFVFFPRLALAETPKPSVMVAKLKAENLSDRFLYPATLSAFRVVTLHSDADGLVSDLKVELGQKVQAGQTLAFIRNPDPIYEFKPYAVTAAFSGIVTSVDIAVGDRVTKQRPLFTLADLRSIKIKIHLTADDLLVLKPQDRAILLVHGKEFPLRIRAMSPMIDPATGTAPCELELVDSSKIAGLVPGSLGKVVFETNRRKGVIVPEAALVYRGRDPFVIRVTDKKTAQYVPVKILKHDVGRMEIQSELKEGDTFISNAMGFIAEGEALQTQDPEEKKAKAEAEEKKGGST